MGKKFKFNYKYDKKSTSKYTRSTKDIYSDKKYKQYVTDEVKKKRKELRKEAREGTKQTKEFFRDTDGRMRSRPLSSEEEKQIRIIKTIDDMASVINDDHDPGKIAYSGGELKGHQVYKAFYNPRHGRKATPTSFYKWDMKGIKRDDKLYHYLHFGPKRNSLMFENPDLIQQHILDSYKKGLREVAMKFIERYKEIVQARGGENEGEYGGPAIATGTLLNSWDIREDENSIYIVNTCPYYYFIEEGWDGNRSKVSMKRVMEWMQEKGLLEMTEQINIKGEVDNLLLGGELYDQMMEKVISSDMYTKPRKRKATPAHWKELERRKKMVLDIARGGYEMTGTGEKVVYEERQAIGRKQLIKQAHLFTYKDVEAYHEAKEYLITPVAMRQQRKAERMTLNVVAAVMRKINSTVYPGRHYGRLAFDETVRSRGLVKKELIKAYKSERGKRKGSRSKKSIATKHEDMETPKREG